MRKLHKRRLIRRANTAQEKKPKPPQDFSEIYNANLMKDLKKIINSKTIVP